MTRKKKSFQHLKSYSYWNRQKIAKLSRAGLHMCDSKLCDMATCPICPWFVISVISFDLFGIVLYFSCYFPVAEKGRKPSNIARENSRTVCKKARLRQLSSQSSYLNFLVFLVFFFSSVAQKKSSVSVDVYINFLHSNFKCCVLSNPRARQKVCLIFFAQVFGLLRHNIRIKKKSFFFNDVLSFTVGRKVCSRRCYSRIPFNFQTVIVDIILTINAVIKSVTIVYQVICLAET